MLVTSRVLNKSVFLAVLLVVGLLFTDPLFAAYIEYVGAASYSADMSNVVSADGRYVVVGNTVYDRTLDTSDNFHASSAEVVGNSFLTATVPSISDDGRYVAFSSTSTNLDSVTPDTNGVADLFVRDRTLGTTERANVSSSEVEANAAVGAFQISGNGRFVVFDTAADNLVVGDTNGVEDIFVRDLDAGTTTRVSLDALGAETDNASEQPSASYDGQYVAFRSSATNLVPGYASGQLQVYVKDTDTGDVEIVSIKDDGTAGNSSSRNPFISGSGQFVAFESFSSNLVTGDINVDFDIFVYDRDSDTQELVSKNNSAVQGNGTSLDSSISTDGRYVYFWSSATNLASVTAAENVFLYDRTEDDIELVTQSSDGVPGNQNTRYGSVSADGTHVAFFSDANNLVSGQGSGIYLREVNQAPTDIFLSGSLINENEEVGSTIGTLTTEDANSDDTHSYSFSCDTPGVDDSSFSIATDSLKNAEEFNYEDKNSYNICIRSEDDSGGTFDKDFTITVINENESTGGSSGGGQNNPPPPPPDPTPIDPPPPPLAEPTEEPIEPPPEPEEPVEPPINPEEPSLESEETAPSPEDNSNEKTPKNIVESVSDATEKIAGAIIEVVEEIPRDVSETVSVIGAALPTLAFAITQPAVAANFVSIPIRLWNLIPVWLGFRRKKRPWGTVYDSVTKQPLDPVYVTLSNLNGHEVATTITDIDGRFGFLVPPGRYKIKVKKDNYEFPSKKLAAYSNDQLYGNLYMGEEIEITGGEDLVIKNIPMDATNFNWNEFTKSRNKELMKFYSKRDLFIAKIANIAFWIGLVFSLALLLSGPSTINYILFGIYAVVLVLRMFGIKPKKPGYITHSENGYPLSYGIVKIFSTSLHKEIAHAVIGKTGKYYALVPNGEYYVSIEEKVGENEYKKVYDSQPFKVQKGFVGKTFKI